MTQRWRHCVWIVLASCLPTFANDLQPTILQAKALANNQDFMTAIQLLESKLTEVNGDPNAVSLLRSCYRGQLRVLSANGEVGQAQKLLKKLHLLEGVPTAPPQSPAANRDTDRAANRRLNPGVPADSAGGRTNVDANVEAANLLFDAQQFGEAEPLYKSAILRGSVQQRAVLHRWVYCRLHRIVAVLNAQPQVSDPAKIAAELDELLRLVPGNAFIRSLKARLTKPQSNNLATIDRPLIVRANSPEPDRKGLIAGLATRIGLGIGKDNPARSLWRRFQKSGWEIVETSNFRVHSTDLALASSVADIAERARLELYSTWFSSRPGKAWSPKCDIYLHDSASSYVKATRQGPASPGYSTTRVDRGRITGRRVDLRKDGPDLVKAIVPHEVTHIVMMDRFTVRELPRWADEGIAVLSEPVGKKHAHLRNLQRFASQGKVYSSKQLMQMRDYPAGEWWPLFYSQSVALVEFLVQRHGPDRFIEFMDQALKQGYEPALRRVYSLNSFEELDAAWGKTRNDQLQAGNEAEVAQLRGLDGTDSPRSRPLE